jgi:hypothetical protein
MKSGVWSLSKRMFVTLTRIQWAELNKMEFWKGIWYYEACISQTRRQKTNLKSRQHILGVIIQYSSTNTGTTKVGKGQIQETKNTIQNVYTTIGYEGTLLFYAFLCQIVTDFSPHYIIPADQRNYLLSAGRSILSLNMPPTLPCWLRYVNLINYWQFNWMLIYLSLSLSSSTTTSS